jgi:DNA-3-methyladenine glycosylase
MRSTPFPVIEAETLHSKRTVFLARWLLGKFLVRRFSHGTQDARMILETEAYKGESDLACHARAGRTKRTEVMYREGGVWYVYLCYGIHEMLNLVVGPRDWPAAILIRGVEGAIGPGRVTKALAIDRKLNAKAVAPSSDLWLEDRGVHVPRSAVKVTPRIGVDYAGPIWSAKHWRFTCHPGELPPLRPARPKPESSPTRRRL